MRALAPAWPPKARVSSTATERPSDAAYTAVGDPGAAEACGRGILGGGDPGRSGADDRDVVDAVVAGTADHADRARKLGFARIAQHRTIGGDDQRPVVRLGRITRDDIG